MPEIEAPPTIVAIAEPIHLREERRMTALSISERADALEHQKMRELDVIIVKSRLFTLGDRSEERRVGQ